MILKPNKKKVKLKDCPVGLFLDEDTLCIKTEYANNAGIPECYIISSGERHWAAVKVTEYLDILVTPVNLIKETEFEETKDRFFIISFQWKTMTESGNGELDIKTNGFYPTRKYISENVIHINNSVTELIVINIIELNETDFKNYLKNE